MTVTDQIVAFSGSVRLERVDPTARATAARAFVDTIASAIAGWGEPVTEKVLRHARAGNPGAPLLGAPGLLAAESAALVNGTAAHALDYDDVSPTVTTHSSAVIVPAVLSAAYVADRSGQDAITAYLIGVEVLTRVGEVMGFGHYRLGWHATSTLGSIGAAVAAGYLMGLTPEQLRWAVGISASLSGGLRRNFGTMTKPFHAGLAAENGVRAAILATEGITADEDIFGPGGYFHAMSGGQAAPAEHLPLGKPFDIITGGLAIKAYPCCWATHRMIDGMLELRLQHGLTPEVVQRIECIASPGLTAPLNHARPETGLEGKFSGHYTLAAALIDGKVNLASFTDAAVQRPEVIALVDRTDVHEAVPSSERTQGLADGVVRVAVTLRTGQVLETEVRSATGSPQRPLTDTQLGEKVADCLQFYSRQTGRRTPAASRLLTACFEMDRAAGMQRWMQSLQELIES